MSDHDMNVFNNPELGQNGTSPFLDEIEAQLQENRNAELEGRLPRRVIPRQRFGEYANSHIVGPLELGDGVPDVSETTEEDYFQDLTIDEVETKNQPKGKK